MRLTIRQRILAGIILSLTAATTHAAPVSGQGTWETTLQGRLPLTQGGTDYQAYYDTDLNITWLADANAGAGTIYDDGFFTTDGQMPWASAQAWIASLNTANHLGVNDWRLPIVAPVNGSTFNYTSSYDGSTDFGYNVSAPGSAFPGTTASEMAHMFYNTLGNTGALYTSGSPTGCSDTSPPCLTNDGPFSNLQPVFGYPYWSGTTYAPGTQYAWSFYFGLGWQGANFKMYDSYAWAVRDGDIGIVPIPAVGWLLAPAFGLLGWVRRRSIS